MTKPTFEQATTEVMRHITERHWDDNSARGLAISISLEANELLEHYQWQDQPVGDTHELADELADIFIYAIQFAKRHDIDIPTAIIKKLAKSAKKYPAEQFTTKNETERKKAWIKAKTQYKKDTIL